MKIDGGFHLALPGEGTVLAQALRRNPPELGKASGKWRNSKPVSSVGSGRTDGGNINRDGTPGTGSLWSGEWGERSLPGRFLPK